MNRKIISLLESNQLPNWHLAAAVAGVDEVCEELRYYLLAATTILFSDKNAFEKNLVICTKKGIYISICAWYDLSVHLVFCNGERLVMKNTQRPTVEEVTEYFCKELKNILK